MEEIDSGFSDLKEKLNIEYIDHSLSTIMQPRRLPSWITLSKKQIYTSEHRLNRLETVPAPECFCVTAEVVGSEHDILRSAAYFSLVCGSRGSVSCGLF